MAITLKLSDLNRLSDIAEGHGHIRPAAEGFRQRQHIPCGSGSAEQRVAGRSIADGQAFLVRHITCDLDSTFKCSTEPLKKFIAPSMS